MFFEIKLQKSILQIYKPLFNSAIFKCYNKNGVKSVTLIKTLLISRTITLLHLENGKSLFWLKHRLAQLNLNTSTVIFLQSLRVKYIEDIPNYTRVSLRESRTGNKTPTEGDYRSCSMGFQEEDCGPTTRRMLMKLTDLGRKSLDVITPNYNYKF